MHLGGQLRLAMLLWLAAFVAGSPRPMHVRGLPVDAGTAAADLSVTHMAWQFGNVDFVDSAGRRQLQAVPAVSASEVVFYFVDSIAQIALGEGISAFLGLFNNDLTGEQIVEQVEAAIDAAVNELKDFIGDAIAQNELDGYLVELRSLERQVREYVPFMDDSVSRNRVNGWWQESIDLLEAFKREEFQLVANIFYQATLALNVLLSVERIRLNTAIEGGSSPVVSSQKSTLRNQISGGIAYLQDVTTLIQPEINSIEVVSREFFPCPQVGPSLVRRCINGPAYGTVKLCLELSTDGLEPADPQCEEARCSSDADSEFDRERAINRCLDRKETELRINLQNYAATTGIPQFRSRNLGEFMGDDYQSIVTELREIAGRYPAAGTTRARRLRLP